METMLQFFSLIKLGQKHERRKRKTCWKFACALNWSIYQQWGEWRAGEVEKRGNKSSESYTQKKTELKKVNEERKKSACKQSGDCNKWKLFAVKAFHSPAGMVWMFIWIKYELAKNELYEADKSIYLPVMFERVQKEVVLGGGAFIMGIGNISSSLVIPIEFVLYAMFWKCFSWIRKLFCTVKIFYSIGFEVFQ